MRALIATIAIAAVGIAGTGSAFAQEYAFEFGEPGADPPERLGHGISIAVDADGNPWVADMTENRVVKFDYSGRFVASLPNVGPPPTNLETPTGIAADDRGYVYVSYGAGSNRIAKIDTGGELETTFTARRANGSQIDVDKVAVGPDGSIYVSEGVNTIYKLGPDGSQQERLNLSSSWAVNDVSVAGDTVLISFRTGNVDEGGVARYSLDLKRSLNTTVLRDVSLRDVGGGSRDLVYVADYRNSRVTEIDYGNGAAIRHLGAAGIGTGQMNGPSAIAVDCRGSFYVVDTAARYDGPGGPRAGSKVMKFDVGGAPPPCGPPRPLTGAIDTQVNDVAITQAIQPSFTHTAGPFLAPGQISFTLPENQPRTRAYGTTNAGPSGEVPLKAALATVVRVYSTLTSGPVGGIANVPATLEGFAGGRSLGTIQPVGRPGLLQVGDRTVGPALRSEPNAPYSFAIPDEWTRKGTIDLVARVNPASIGCDSQCANRSTFRLTGASFGNTRVAPIEPVALTDGGQPPVNRAEKAFEPAKRVTPLLLEVHGYQAQAEVGDLIHAESIKVESCFLGVFPCDEDTYAKGSPKYREYLQGELFDRLERVADDVDIDECDRVPMGLISGTNGQLPGAMRGEFLAAGLLPCAIGYATVIRPFTAVAHELQHAFSRPHAGLSCPGTGPDDDQEGESWPPDQKGFLDGIGLNTTQRAATSRGPFAVIAPGVEERPGQLYDLMSYCADDENGVWMSARGWRALSGWRVNSAEVKAGVVRAERAAARRGNANPNGERLLRVTAVETSDGDLGITAVAPTSVPEPAGPASSPYVLQATRADGSVLAEQRVVAHETGDGPGKLIVGTVPAPEGTEQVFLKRGNETGTRRVGSPSPPTLRLKAPKARSKVKGKAMNVTWSSNDPDGGELTATVEFSTNGRSWSTVFIGPDTGKARVLTSMLSGSKKAVVRVRIDDGFNEAVKTSKRFTVIPPAPQVTIEEPAGKLTIRADAPLSLRGSATGAGGRLLKGKGLVWRDGRKKLGKGPSVLADGLRPGKRRIQLSAKQGGKTGRATVQVVVQAVKPGFLALAAPEKLGKKAKSAKLRVASTVAAKLKVGGKRFAVSTRPRTVKAPVKRGKGPAKLKLQLSSGKQKTSQTITIARG